MKRFYYFMAVSLLWVSCQKSILDRQPNDQMTEEAAFADILVTEKFLNNIYAELYGSIYNRTPNYLLSGTTDEAEIGNLTTGGVSFNRGSLSPMDYPLGDYWTIYYRAIRKTNIFLKNIDGVSGDPEIKSRMKGEALFLKAFFNQQLFKYFGEFIIVDQVLNINEDLSIPKSTMEECAAYIVSLADQAASLLPITHETSQLGRATKGAALALKAEALLFYASPLYNPTNDKQRWEKAATAAAAILDNPNFEYDLYDDYKKLFLVNNNSEVIFAYMASASTNAMEQANGPSGYGGWCGVSPTQEMVDAYEMANGITPFNTDGSINTSSGYDPANPYANRDPRFYTSILYNGAQWQGRAIESFVDGADGISIGTHTRSQTGYFLRKFMDESIVINSNQRRAATWILFRLGTVLLDFAESHNEAAGPDEKVYAAVNAIRERAHMPALPAGLNQDEMRNRIRHERRIEMAFEDNRFWDVRRWKQGVEIFGKPVHGMRITRVGNNLNYERVQVRARVFDDRRHFFPIPQSELNKNPNLIQNKGW